MSYVYDAMGRRISKTVGSGTPTQYLYDGVNGVQETQGSTINPILVGLGVDERFARNDTTGRTYFLSDAINSTIALTNSSGAIQNTYSYDHYGNATQSNATLTNPYQYAGRETDTAGLYYYRARYYSPMMGSFISEDPARFAGGQLSFYAYVDGNPLNYIDPYGLWCLSEAAIGAISGGVGGFVGGAVTGGIEGFLVGGPAGALGGALGIGIESAAAGAVIGAVVPSSTAAAGYTGALTSGITDASNSSIAGGFVGGAVTYAAQQAGAPLWLAGGSGGFAGGAVTGFFRVPAAATWAAAGRSAAIGGLGGLLGGVIGGITQELLEKGQDCGCKK